MARERAAGRCRRSPYAPRAARVLRAPGMPNRITAGMPRSRDAAALLGRRDRPTAARRRACCATGLLDAACPGTTNSGRMSWSTLTPRLAHHAAQRLAAPQPARAVGGEATHRTLLGLVDRPRRVAKMLDAAAAGERRRPCSRPGRRRPRRPAARAVSAVIGPMQATTGRAARTASRPRRAPSSATKLRTVRAAGEGERVDRAAPRAPRAARRTSASAGGTAR